MDNEELTHRVGANERLAFRLLALLAGVGAVLALLLLTPLLFLIGFGLLALPLGLAVAGGVGCAVAYWFWTTAVDRVLASTGATRRQSQSVLRVENLLRSLSLTSGVPVPEVWVVESTAVNALALGLHSRDSRLVLTTGALEHLGRIELEALVAWELGRIRFHDVSPDTLFAAVLLAFRAVLAESSIQRLRTSLVDPDRFLDADLDALWLTRYPPGLRAALAVAESNGHIDADPALSHLWFVEPDSESADRPSSPAVLSIGARQMVLEEL